MKLKYWKNILAAVLIQAIAGCSVVPMQKNADTLEYVRFEETSAFQTIYPAGWEANIIETGILVFAESEVLGGSMPGASVTVYRDAPSGSEESLEDLMNHFLQHGPLRGNFQISSSIRDTMIDARPGLEVDVENAAESGKILGRIFMVKLANNAVYYFAATAPDESWDEDWMLMEQIVLQTVFTEG